MTEEAPLADLAAYEARYGPAADAARASALLADASAMLVTAYERRWGEAREEGAHPEFDRSAAAVCCAVAHRALSAPGDMAGVSRYSQGAGAYTASVSFSNPTGDLWLSKSDLSRLGLDGCEVWSIPPMTDADRGGE